MLFRSPGFFLHALDAKTGQPVEGFGEQIPIEGFPETGSVDMLADLGHPYDVYEGIDPEGLDNGAGDSTPNDYYTFGPPRTLLFGLTVNF